MFSSLRSRLWLTYALLVGVVICIAGMALVVYLARNPFASRQEYQRLRLVASLLVQRSDVTDGLARIDQPDQLLPLLRRVDAALNVRILVLNPQGMLLADSGAGRDALGAEIGYYRKPPGAQPPIFPGCSRKDLAVCAAPAG